MSLRESTAKGCRCSGRIAQSVCTCQGELLAFDKVMRKRNDGKCNLLADDGRNYAAAARNQRCDAFALIIFLMIWFPLSRNVTHRHVHSIECVSNECRRLLLFSSYWINEMNTNWCSLIPSMELCEKEEAARSLYSTLFWVGALASH